MIYSFPSVPHIELVISQVEKATGLKLMARTPDDTVNGHVNIRGNVIEVVFYEVDENPNKFHNTTFKAAALPSNATVKTALTNAGLI